MMRARVVRAVALGVAVCEVIVVVIVFIVLLFLIVAAKKIRCNRSSNCAYPSMANLMS
jgi:hypothetical protein